MSHSELDRRVFANSPEWRRERARIAALTRHGSAVEEHNKGYLEVLKTLGFLRALVEEPGDMELDLTAPEGWYELVDWVGSLLAPSSFVQPLELQQ